MSSYNSESCSPKLSSYACSLNGVAKARYLQKLSCIGDFDPLPGLPRGAESVKPPVDTCDLVPYLVLETSFVTAEQFKARKGLEAYNQFVCGWVKEVKSVCLNGKHVTVGRVRHCQRFSETPLHCWIITEVDGSVCCAHCNCMAGLGETCTHVAAVLFFFAGSCPSRRPADMYGPTMPVEAAFISEEHGVCANQGY